ncbi:MAG TPA: AraC family transcriptional regulator [Lentisphaeria bacterium]|nr:AraC family transcriptional regulator [Lentisphaeria bacterium]
MPDTILRSQVFRDAEFPLAVQRIPQHGSGDDQHAHAFHELVLIMKGHGTHAVGPESYKLETGDVFVIQGDTTHGYMETDKMTLVNILYDPDQLRIPHADLGGLPGYQALFCVEPQVRRHRKFQSRLRLGIDELARASNLVAELAEELTSRTPGYRFMATTHLMRLLGYLSRCYSQLDLDLTRPVNQISKVLGYLERHFTEPVQVADLVKVAGMSQTSLMRHFGQVMERSPVDYLIHLRVNHAKRLLRGTQFSISEVALQSGFCDSNYLARQFRRVAGVSPREYRRQAAGSALP